MPRKAKDETKIIDKKETKQTPNSKKVATKKEHVVKIVNSNSPSKKSKKEFVVETTNMTTTKKKTAKNTNLKKKSTTNKKASTTTKKTVTSKKQTAKRKQTNPKVEIVEYYDLPYRYNQTVVKVLAQTPTTLFVYWDISDDDRKKYIEQYGEYFFCNTKPVLLIHNKTKNYDFEIEINDFANSWYLHSINSNCDYQIELGRRPINQYANLANNYLSITTSNEIESPNDHILFDKLSHFVYFRNVKTNETIKKYINLTLLNKIGKISSAQEFYKKLYPEEAIDFDRLDLSNPSSSNPTSSFK